MKLKEVLDQSIEEEATDLQALIMFLVFEMGDKTGISLEDDVSKLEKYFKPNNRERLTSFLNEYKNKINMEYPPSIFKVQAKQGQVIVYANNEGEAKYESYKLGHQPIEVDYLPKDKLMTGEQWNPVVAKDLIKGHTPPYVIGVNEIKGAI